MDGDRASTARRRCAAAAALLFAAGIAAADNADRFILPETPPTIEQYGKAPLDRPVLKRQSYVSDPDVTMPPALLDLRFTPMEEARGSVLVSMGAGSFSERRGAFSYADGSKLGLGYTASSTDGETPLFAREEHLLSGFWRGWAGSSRAGCSASARELTYSGQKHTAHDAAADISLLPYRGITVAGSAAWDGGTVAGDENNSHTAALVSAAFQPWNGHELTLAYAPEHDTAFAKRDFATATGRYRMAVLPDLVAGAGCTAQDGSAYPWASLQWTGYGIARCAVEYKPGIEKPLWNDLYLGDAVVKTNPGLKFPENRFWLEESMSLEDGPASVALKFTQKNTDQAIFWNTVGAAITPANHDALYSARARLDARYKSIVTPFVSAEYASDHYLPLVPEQRAAAGVECTIGPVRLNTGYAWCGPRSSVEDGPSDLEASGDFRAGAVWAIPGGLELSASAANLAGQASEDQPGYKRTARLFDAGITARF